MSYQHGIHTLNNVDQIQSVTFPTPFSAAPTIIIPVVRNVSGAVSVMDIGATVVGTPSGSGFSVLLSAIPDSSDYTLTWIAGSMEAVFEALSQGQRLSTFPVVAGSLADADKLIILRNGPYASTELIRWDIFRANFANQVEIPTAPTSPGAVNQIALPSAVSPWMFCHNGTQWTRIPVDAGGSWTSERVLTQYREGVQALANGTQVHAITFSTPFPGGSALSIKCQLRNLSGSTPISVLHGLVTVQSVSGFTYTTSAPTDSVNFELAWEARLRTDI